MALQLPILKTQPSDHQSISPASSTGPAASNHSHNHSGSNPSNVDKQMELIRKSNLLAVGKTRPAWAHTHLGV